MAYESFEAKHGKYLYYREGSKYLVVDWKVSGQIHLKVRGPYIELFNHRQKNPKLSSLKSNLISLNYYFASRESQSKPSFLKWTVIFNLDLVEIWTEPSVQVGPNLLDQF